MSTQFPQLASGPKMTTYNYAHLIRQPGDPIVQQVFEFENLSLKVREFLSQLKSTQTRDKAPRTLVVQGAPGQGKSLGCLVGALTSGFAAAVVSASELAGETEGKSVEVLREILDELTGWSNEHGLPIVIIIDDIDLSIMNVDANTGHTVGTNMLIQEFQYLADNRHLYRSEAGHSIGFIVTVNDATNMRESLYREGRAVWYDHMPTTEDKANIAWALLNPKTQAERALTEKLTRKFRSQPVAFWNQLCSEMQAIHARRALANGMPDTGTLDRLYGQRVPLVAEIAWPCAKAIRSRRARSWLKKRGFFRSH